MKIGLEYSPHLGFIPVDNWIETLVFVYGLRMGLSPHLRLLSQDQTRSKSREKDLGKSLFPLVGEDSSPTH